MSVCYASDVVAYAKSQKGTAEGKNNWNPYAKMLDDCNYFTPQKKQNEPWCCVYVDACVYVASGKVKSKTNSVLYQPAKNNYSAVVKYLAGYFKDHGAYFTDKDKVEKGDVVFFNEVNDSGKVISTMAHTGLVIDRDERGITTSEGNKHNKVSECQYLFTSIGTKIAGFGKPKYDKEPSPEPPTPTETTYKVATKYRPLTVRKEPTTKSEDVGELPKGSTFTSSEVVKGEDVKGCDAWVKTDKGYANGYYLEPTPVYEVEEPEPLPIPEPVKPQPVVYPKYKVKTVTGEWLALRVAPNTKSVLIVRMEYGAEVELINTIPGEKIYGSNEWAQVRYTKNGKTFIGYCIKSRLKKV